jgi:DNA transposition AAA+ family ATPase
VAARAISGVMVVAAVDNGWTNGEIAQGCGYSEAAISGYRGHSYAPSVRFLDSVEAYLARASAGAPRFVETVASKEVAEACELARRRRHMVLVVGEPGTGKSVALAEYARRQRLAGRNPIITVAASTMTPADLLAEIAAALDLSTRGTGHTLLLRCVEALRRTPRLIVIDEAQHLRVKHLEAVRALNDTTRCGVVLAGSLAILRTLRDPGPRGQELQQLWSRVALQRRLSPMDKTEARRFVETITTVPFEPTATEHLVKRAAGVPRVLAMAIERVLDIAEINGATTITPEIARAATDELAAPRA